MTCSVYPSRTYLLTMLVVLALVLAAWGYFVLPRASAPFVLRITSGAFIAAALLACTVSLLARKPVIRVDNSGIAYHPKWLPKIEWADVVDVERAPLIEPTPDGLVYHLKDGWRPINIFVGGPNKYLPQVPTVFRQRMFMDEQANSLRFQIEFLGLSPLSAEVYDCIRRHLDGRGANG